MKSLKQGQHPGSRSPFLHFRPDCTASSLTTQALQGNSVVRIISPIPKTPPIQSLTRCGHHQFVVDSRPLRTLTFSSRPIQSQPLPSALTYAQTLLGSTTTRRADLVALGHHSCMRIGHLTTSRISYRWAVDHAFCPSSSSLSSWMTMNCA